MPSTAGSKSKPCDPTGGERETCNASDMPEGKPRLAQNGNEGGGEPRSIVIDEVPGDGAEDEPKPTDV